ncbi:MAG: helix-turn-helix transcriptional regulator, partial [Myxacorys chilensis ATA2-1-KO14]|nr:helix-turn-helix transcriptional regulator [Myxacorys chilensis ATA2-1-KO14]
MPLQKPHLLKQPEVSRFVRELRQLTAMTQEQFGVQIGVSYEAISRRENGRMQPSSLALRQLERIMQELD